MKSILNHPHISLLVLAWFCADLIVPALIAVSERLGAVDRPQGYKAHKEPVSFLGGVGIFAAIAIALLSTMRFPQAANYPSVLDYFVSGEGRSLAGILLGGAIVLAVGLIDDYRRINAVMKLFILFLTTLLLSNFGVILDLFPNDQAWGYGLDLVFTLLWVAGVSSATNSLDNMDGAAGGLAAIASAAVFYIAWGTSAESAQPWLSYVAIALLGACLGFLRYNYPFPNARIFLGDNGSLLVGFLLSTMLVLGGWAENPAKAIVIPCVILTVPLFDITLSTILRYKSGVVGSWKEAVVYCGRDHLSHRLMAFGMSKVQALWCLYGMGMLSGFWAVLIWKSQEPRQIATFLAVYFSTLVIIGWKLDQAPVYDAPGDSASAPSAGDRTGALR